MKDERVKEERGKIERVSRHADEIPTNFNLCEKTTAKERGILMPLHRLNFTTECTDPRKLSGLHRVHKDLLAKSVNM